MLPNKPSIYVVVERTPEDLVQGSPNIHARQPFVYHSKTASASTNTVAVKPDELSSATTNAEYGLVKDQVKVVPTRFRHLSNSAFVVVTRDLSPSGGQPFVYTSDTATVATKSVAAKGMMSSETTNAEYGLGL